MKSYKNFRKRILITSSTLALSLIVVTPTFASTKWGRTHLGEAGQTGVVGSVTGVSGSTISLVGKFASTTDYIVDAANAKIVKNGSTINVSDIQVNDVLLVRGTVSGTNVAATNIVDGKPGVNHSENIQHKSNISIGTISAINGASFTLDKWEHGTTTAATALTVVTDNNTLFKLNGKTATSTGGVGNLAIGQRVVVLGSVANNTVTATSVNIMARLPVRGMHIRPLKNK
ncbi:MAG: DUF5666 domain-containing protein [Candidatus Pacebacteria bacterium]|nr:DUF5666 domain-containing protein [Candidatus Paceibacterota bacterium]